MHEYGLLIYSVIDINLFRKSNEFKFYIFISDPTNFTQIFEMSTISIDDEFENENYNYTENETEIKFTWEKGVLTTIFFSLIIVTVVSIFSFFLFLNLKYIHDKYIYV